MSVFLEPEASQQRDPDQQHIFQVEPETLLRATFGFAQSYPETKTFRVFFLLNYEQIPVGASVHVGVDTTSPLLEYPFSMQNQWMMERAPGFSGSRNSPMPTVSSLGMPCRLGRTLP